NLDKEAIEAAVDVPINVAVVVARLVLAVIAKLEARAPALAAILTLVRARRVLGRAQAQAVQHAHEVGGEQRPHGQTTISFLACWINSPRRSSTSIPSASASKLRMMRCRRAGGATATTSSTAALKRPRINALALAAKIKA